MRAVALFIMAATLAVVSAAAEPAQVRGVAKKGAKSSSAKALDLDSLSVPHIQTPEQKPGEVEQQTLRAAGLSTDADSLLEFFRERARPTSDLDMLLVLARQLGDGNA